MLTNENGLKKGMNGTKNMYPPPKKKPLFILHYNIMSQSPEDGEWDKNVFVHS